MVNKRRGCAALAALGFSLAFGSGQAAADPGAGADPVAQTVTDAAAPVSTGPVSSGPVSSAGTAPANGTAHLPSPESLPPGTTQAAPEQRSLGYLRDIWNAVRHEDVTMRDALLLLAQRPMDAPTEGMSPHTAGPVDGSAAAPSDQAPTQATPSHEN